MSPCPGRSAMSTKLQSLLMLLSALWNKLFPPSVSAVQCIRERSRGCCNSERIHFGFSPLTIPHRTNLLTATEVDSHIEVVLLGDGIFDAQYVQALQSRLEALGMVSAAASPLRHIHEKLLYHTVIGTTIQKTVGALLRGAEELGTLDPAAMAKILGDYHTRASTGTTLFVLHRQLPAGITYKYSSNSLPNMKQTCWQRTFIAQDASFAWIDISAQASEIQPVIAEFPVLTTPMQELQFFTKDQGRTIDSLAALIHRSGEAFNQFPVPVPDKVQAAYASQGAPDEMPMYKSKIEVLGITICVEDEAKGHSLCEHDLAVSVVAHEMARLYGDASSSISFNAVKYGLNDEAEFAHAFFSSIHHSSTSTVTIIDSNEMLFWLSSSRKVRDLMSGFAHAGSAVVPVFVLKMPPSVATFFDVPDQRSVATTFPVPAGSKHSQWPKNVVLYARSVDLPIDALSDEGSAVASAGQSDEAAASGNTSIRRFPVLHCGDAMLPAGSANEVVKDELRDGIKRAIWGLAAGHTRFSSSSQGPVEDFLWHTPVPIRLTGMEIPINTGESFADKRTVPRLRFINQAEDVLRQFVHILHQAKSVHPPINSTLLFEVGLGESTTSAGASAAAAVGFSKKAQSPSAVKKLTAIRKSQKSPGLLSDFLTHMDLAASDFSHMDFVMALTSLNNAEKLLDKFRKRMLVILNTRSGALTCGTSEREDRAELQAMYEKLQEMRATMFPGHPQGSESDKKVDGVERDGQDGAITETSAPVFGQFRVLMKVILGAIMTVMGAFAGAYAREIQEKYRKHYL